MQFIKWGVMCIEREILSISSMFTQLDIFEYILLDMILCKTAFGSFCSPTYTLLLLRYHIFRGFSESERDRGKLNAHSNAQCS